MRKNVWILVACAVLALFVVRSQSLAADNTIDRGILWVQSSAEFEALALQAYRAASEDLDKFIADPVWSALPGQHEASNLPLAIIADVDETIVSNVEFQAQLQPPFKNSKLDNWNHANPAEPIPGAVQFFRRAQDSGVQVFFLTNRPCEKKAGVADPCPQKAVTIQDLREIGISVDADHVMLAGERPEWDREKSIRREYIAKTHRVIMLLGDDLGDFIACTRAKPLHPCTGAATIDSRHAATYQSASYWGEGWYMLPNPMHGSWTTVN